MTKKQVKSAYDIRRKRRTEKAHPTSRHKLWTSVSYPVYFVYNFISSSLARRPQLEQHQHPITTTNTTTSTTSTIAPTTTGTQHTLSNWDRATRNAAARGLRRRYILSYTKNTARTVFSKRWMRQAVRWDLVGVSLSKCWGTINSRPLPQWARRPIYQMWGRVFKCNMDEVREPLHTYPTLAAFFARQLKDGARPICEQGMASPVDGRVISCGPVDGDLLEQIKGKTYSLSSFLGYKYDDLCNKNSADHPTRLYQCIVSTGIASFMLYSLMLRQIYLSPGDYHRIHFPVACSINKRRHFPGTLFPVNYPFLRMIPSLFALNERVVLMGDWPEGFFSLTAVGAYPIWLNRIEVRLHAADQPNYKRLYIYFSWNGVGSYAYERDYRAETGAVAADKGDECGQFHFGSTVVLIFEAADFHFNIQPGDYLQMGQKIGDLTPNTTSTSTSSASSSSSTTTPTTPNSPAL